MLIVENGEKSARVVALQILLNRDPAIRPKLVTDGSFGPKTGKAIDTYRERVMMQSGPTHVADPTMWSFLLARAQLQVVEAVDITDPLVLEETVPKLSPGAITVQIGGMSNGISQVVTDIRARARGQRSIMMLRFHGHGAPGLIAISAGSRRSTGGIDGIAAHSVLTLPMLQTFAPWLRQLGPLLNNFGFIELHSCRIAQGVQGAMFLRELANTFGAPVRAALSKQQMARVYTLVGQTRSGFPGNTTLRQWAFSRDEAVRSTQVDHSPFKDVGWPPSSFKDAGWPFK